MKYIKWLATPRQFTAALIYVDVESIERLRKNIEALIEELVDRYKGEITPDEIVYIIPGYARRHNKSSFLGV